PNLMEADMNRAMIAATGRLIVLADHTKWGVVGLCAMAQLADVSVLVSDGGLSTEARDALGSLVGLKAASFMAATPAPRRAEQPDDPAARAAAAQSRGLKPTGSAPGAGRSSDSRSR